MTISRGRQLLLAKVRMPIGRVGIFIVEFAHLSILVFIHSEKNSCLGIYKHSHQLLGLQ